MLEHMKKPITEKFAEICIRVPVEDVAMIREFLKSTGRSVDISERAVFRR